ncbi:MAG: hypothetical protein OXG04_18515 [Acidobacteria bacterium]|nr:hypothetical protein [Acidobacteriota bacterium]
MTAALVTATVLGIGGLGYVTVLGFLASAPEEISRHVTFAIFFTFITLLAHSMTMFYLIGKGKAIREAVTDGGLSDELHLAVARARRPVFSTGTLAMALTMFAAILGGGVDTGVLPAVAHSLPAVLACVTNLLAFRAELVALATATDSVTEVNRLLE